MNFNPPKPTMLEGIQDLRRLFKEQMIEFFLQSVFTELLSKRGHFQYTRTTVANLPH